jgi:hypothetical protein
VYDVVFWANNLPSMTPLGEHVVPDWTGDDLEILREVIITGVAMLRSASAQPAIWGGRWRPMGVLERVASEPWRFVGRRGSGAGHVAGGSLLVGGRTIEGVELLLERRDRLLDLPLPLVAISPRLGALLADHRHHWCQQ